MGLEESLFAKNGTTSPSSRNGQKKADGDWD